LVALLLAAGVAMFVSLIGTPFLISWLRVHGIGQPIHEDMPSGHVTKAGTPTMGGVMIVAGALVGYTVGHVRADTIFTWGGILTMLAVAGAGGVGLLDDWIKVTRERNLGLSKRAKTAGLLVVATGFAIAAIVQADVSTNLSFTRKDSIDLDLGNVLWVLFAIVMFYATSNAVNLTDGLDGLAAGSASFSFAAYTVVAFWMFRHEEIYDVPQALDVGLVCAALVGACAGFLWWNAAPARIIMGDTGALAIGAGLAAIALVSNTHLLLPIVGGMYVIEALSVIVQVFTFRVMGRRLFRMAPIHHHFELLGWPETTVIIRFWILGGLCTALALASFYADYLSIPGVID